MLFPEDFSFLSLVWQDTAEFVLILLNQTDETFSQTPRSMTVFVIWEKRQHQHELERLHRP
jgi:hypothetical protein